jgi:ATP-dependent helicase/nuclease subunit A
VAVLVRSSSHAKEIFETLKRAGIPCDGAAAADKSPCERDIIQFLKVIDNPRNDLPLAGFLLSHFGGMTEDEVRDVAELRTAGEDLYDGLCRAASASTASNADATELSLPSSCDVAAKAEAVLARIGEFRVKSSFKTVQQLVSGIVTEFMYDAVYGVEKAGGGEEIRCYIDGLAQFDGVSLSEYLEQYEELSSEPKRVSTGGGYVKLSTYHGFKGLEREVVFVAGVGKMYNLRDTTGDFVLDSDCLGLAYFKRSNRTKHVTLSQFATKCALQRRQIKEELRLFYVALTRAKNYLYVTGSISKERLPDGKCSYEKVPSFGYPLRNSELIFGAVCSGSLPRFAVQVADVEVSNSDDLSRLLPVFPKGDEATVSAIKQRHSFVYPYLEETRLPAKFSVSEVVRGAAGAEHLYDGSISDEYRTTGIVYHSVMEHVDLSASSAEALDGEFERLISENILTAEEALLVDRNAILRCLEHPILQKAAVSKHFRELPFTISVPASELVDSASDAPVTVQGVIDLVIEEEDAVTVLDFKNSYLASPQQIEGYRRQLSLYRRAVESSFGRGKKVRALLYSFKRGDVVSVDI